MADLPMPMVHADVDLRDFPYLPIDVVRLRDSDLTAVATGDEFRCAVLLWCASWHQIPAASLPNQDAVLANLAGFGRDVREWRKLREGALRGWVLCFDNRFYHPVVAEKAMEAWAAKLKQRARTEAARVALSSKRKAPPQPTETDDSKSSPTGDVTMSVTEIVTGTVTESVTESVTGIATGSKREGERKGEGKGSKEPSQPSQVDIGGRGCGAVPLRGLALAVVDGGVR